MNEKNRTTAALEPCCERMCGGGVWVLRVWHDGKQYGDPYDWCATVVKIDHETVEIRGALRAPTPSEWRAIYRTFQAFEWVNVVVWERLTGAVHGRHGWRIKR